VRRLLILVVAAVSFLGFGATGVVRMPSQVALQETSQEATETPASTVQRVFNLGESYAGAGYQLTPHSLLTAASTRPGFAELRLGIHLLNDGLTPIALSDYGLPDTEGRVNLFIQDSKANRWPIDLLQPLNGSRPGSEVIELEPGLGTRWTLGFQVPTDLVATSRLILVIDGTRVSEWDLSTANVGVEYAPPPISTVAIGAQFPWDVQQRATVTGIGSMVCGDPAIEPVAHIITVAMEVENSAGTEYVWPGVQFPDVPAIAQWGDGSSARLTLETFVGEDPGFFHYLGGAGVVLPPLETVQRAFVMAAPRDGRFVDISTLPDGIWLRPPAAAGGAIWVDLSTAAPSIGIDPAMCDLGELPSPIPYAFSPSPKFTVLGEGPFPDPAAQDLAARELLRSALAAAGIYFDGHAQTFASATADAMQAIAPNLTWASHTAGSSLPATVGTAWFAVSSADQNDFYVITMSASGTWFCNLMTAYSSTSSFSGPTSTETAALCIPSLTGDENA
jgi:hypothetical protein